MPRIVRVAVPVPLPQLFDYLPPNAPESSELLPGCRVLVPFGPRRLVGIVVEQADISHAEKRKLRRIEAQLDSQPLLGPELFQSVTWAAQYYQHPLGEAFATALPTALRSPRALPPPGVAAIALTPLGHEALRAGAARRGSRAALLLAALADGPRSLLDLDGVLPKWRAAASRLQARAWVERVSVGRAELPALGLPGPPLTDEQTLATESVQSSLGRYGAFLLEGVTGSGKTEVYLRLILETLRQGRQALVLVPEIGLTPQTLARFRERLPCAVHALHSGLADGERLRTWLAAARGEARVVLGTRSAIFTPLPEAGLIVVDEEHDTSYKQFDGWRYHARDLAVVRARALNVTIVLGSATPALETLANVASGRYQRVHLNARPGVARAPTFRVLDLRSQYLVCGLGSALLDAIAATVARGEQVLVFRNRRGYAPAMLCHACGWTAECTRCERPLTLHRAKQRLSCHHCGAEKRIPSQCPDCQVGELMAQGQGTERIEESLAERFPDVPVIRIDRETTTRKDAMRDLLARLPENGAGILVGTQMLAKGHDLPNLTLVAILGVDQGLHSADFRAGERLAQLLVQVAGRAGRASKPGTVWLQTHHPDHPLLQTLMSGGYPAAIESIAAERRSAEFPPYTHLALLRAEARVAARLDKFLAHAAAAARAQQAPIEVLGPLPAPLAKRAGFVRGQLLLQAKQRNALQAFLPGWLDQVRGAPDVAAVRWSIDVDPVELS